MNGTQTITKCTVISGFLMRSTMANRITAL